MAERHGSWRSDTMLSAAVLVLLVTATVVSDWLNGPSQGPPEYLSGLCAAAGAWLFGAASSDKGKRDRDTEIKADRAERRTLTLNEDQIRTSAQVDRLEQFAREEHPEHSDQTLKSPDDEGVL